MMDFQHFFNTLLIRTRLGAEIGSATTLITEQLRLRRNSFLPKLAMLLTRLKYDQVHRNTNQSCWRKKNQMNEKDFSCSTCKHFKQPGFIQDGECRNLDPRQAAMWNFYFATPIPIGTETETWCGRWERDKTN